MSLTRIFLVVIVGFGVGAFAAAPACQRSSGGDLTISITNFYADGHLDVTLDDSVDMGAGYTCSMYISKFDGTSGSWSSTDCSGGTDFSLDTPSGIWYLRYGTSYQITVEVDDATPTLSCRSVSTVTTAPACTDGSMVATSLSISKFPLSRIEAIPSHAPTSSYCLFYITEWNGAALTPLVAALPQQYVDCSLNAYLESPYDSMSYGAHNVLMVQYTDDSIGASSARSNAPVVCGVNPPATPVTTATCSGNTPDITALSITASLSAYATFTATITVSGSATGYVCRFYINTWGGTDNSGVTDASSIPHVDLTNCVSGDISDGSLPFVFGGSYTFEMEVFPSASAGDESTLICFVPADSSSGSYYSGTSVPSVSCSSSDLQYQWLDNNNARLTIPASPLTIGICEVYISELITTVPSGSVACSGTFDFYDSGIGLSNGQTAHFYYKYFANGSTGGTPDCDTSGSPLAISITQFTCGTDNLDVSGSSGLYTITPPASLTTANSPSIRFDLGTCKVAVSCTYGATNTYTGTYTLTDCFSATSSVAFSALATNIVDGSGHHVISASACSFQYDYYTFPGSGGSPFCSNTLGIKSGVDLSAAPCSNSGATTITVNSYYTTGDFVLGFTHIPTPGGGQSCEVFSTVFAGNTLTVPASSGSCTSPTTFTALSDLRFGVNYEFRIALVASGIEQCATVASTYTPTKCNVSGTATEISVGKFPLGQLQAYMSANVPVDTDICAYYVTEWNGVSTPQTLGTTTSTLSPCTTSSGGIGYSSSMSYGAMAVLAMRVPSGTTLSTIATTQPSCGTDPTTVTFTECAGGETVSDSISVYGTINVNSTASFASGTQCKVNIAKWAGSALSSSSTPSVSSTYTCAANEQVTYASVLWTYGTQYAIEYEEYSAPGTGVDAASGTGLYCYIASADFTVTPSVTCTSSTDLRYSWVGSGIAKINFASPPRFFGACTVTLAGGATTQGLPCVSGDFEIADPTLLANLQSASFSYKFYSSGTVSAPRLDCTSTGTLDVTVQDYVCGTVGASGSDGSLDFSTTMGGSITNPATYYDLGQCKVAVTCGSSYSGHFLLSLCSSTTTLSHNELIALIGEAPAGSSCTLSYQYYAYVDPTVVFCSGSGGSPFTVALPVCDNGSSVDTVLTVGAIYTDGRFSINVTNGPTLGSGQTCWIQLTRASGSLLPRPVSVSSCSSPQTLSLAAASSYLRFGSAYDFQLSVVNDFDGLTLCATTVSVTPPICTVSSTVTALTVGKYTLGQLQIAMGSNVDTSKACAVFISKWNGSAMHRAVAVVDPCDHATHYVEHPTLDMAYGSQQVLVMEIPSGTLLSSINGGTSTVVPSCGTAVASITTTKCPLFPTLIESTTTYGTLSLSLASTTTPSTVCNYSVAKWADTTLSSGDLSGSSSVQTSACTVGSSSLSYSTVPWTYGTSYNVELEQYPSTGDATAGTNLICYLAGDDLLLVSSISCASTDLGYYWIGTGVGRIRLNSVPKAFSSGGCKLYLLGHSGAESSGTCTTVGNTLDITDATYLANTAHAQLYYEYFGLDYTTQSTADCSTVSSKLAFTVTDYDCTGGSVAVRGNGDTGYTLVATNNGFYSTQTYIAYNQLKLRILCAAISGTVATGPSFPAGTTTFASPMSFSDLSQAYYDSVGSFIVPGSACKFGFALWNPGAGSAFCQTTVSAAPAVVLTPPSCGASFALAYTDSGLFSPVFLSGLPPSDGHSCKFELTALAGSPYVDTYNTAATCTSGQTLSDTATPNPIVYGTTYTVAATSYDGTHNDLIYCRDWVSVSPPLCHNTKSVPTVLTVAKTAYSKLSAFLDYLPSNGGKCVFYQTQWNGIVADQNSGLVDCANKYLFSDGVLAFGSSALYSVRMASFAASASIGVDQPLCGTNLVTVLADVCAMSPVVSVSGFGVVRVSMGDSPLLGKKCVVNLINWNSIDRSSSAIRRSSDTCLYVDFAAADVGFLFSYAAVYSFEISEYFSTDNQDRTNPLCSYRTGDVTLPTPTCVASRLQVARPDNESVQVTIPVTPPSYGVCQIELTYYGGSELATPWSVVGPCGDAFDFKSNNSTVIFAPLTTVKFKYSFYDHGDLTDGAVCTSGESSPIVLSDYLSNDCLSLTLSLAEVSVGMYAFEIQNGGPLLGVCALVLTESAGLARTKRINFQDCGSSVILTYADVAALFVSGTSPGDLYSVTLEWWNSAQTQSCTPTASPITVNIRVHHDLKLASPVSTPGSIELLVDSIPTDLLTAWGHGAPVYCVISLIGCDGSMSSATSHVISSCSPGSSTSTFTAPSDDSNCLFSLKVYPSSPSDTSLYGGWSGYLTFSSSGSPSWGMAQSVNITPYANDCMTIAWDYPESDGGTPVMQYTVTQKDAPDSPAHLLGQVENNRFLINCAPQYIMGNTYQVNVTAYNRIGNATLESDLFDPQNLLIAGDSIYTAPSGAQFSAGSFPAVIVQAVSPLDGTTHDTTTTNRIFVARLIAECSGFTDFTNTVPVLVGTNTTTAFTLTFDPRSSFPGQYQLTVDSGYQPIAGSYSLLTYSAQTGGLLGHYFGNPFLLAPAVLTSISPTIDFDWTTGYILDSTEQRRSEQVSVRWTGFVEADFSETYTFTIVSKDFVRLYVDDVLVVNQWLSSDGGSSAACQSVCSGTASLRQSLKTTGFLSDRKFSFIRIDYSHKVSAVVPAISLYWSSPSAGYQLIPSSALFAAEPIQNGLCKNIEIVPGALSTGNSQVTWPTSNPVAGIPFNIYITSKDALGNTLQSHGDSYTASISGTSQGSSLPINSAANDGQYYIALLFDAVSEYDIDVIEAVSSDTVSSAVVSVVANAADHVSASPTYSGSPIVAGEPFTVFVFALDLFGNTIGSSAAVLSNLYATAIFAGDPATDSILSLNDTSTRVEQYGMTFVQSSVAYNQNGDHKYGATLTLPYSGNYDVTIGIHGTGGTAYTGSKSVVAASSVGFGPFAVINSGDSPPSSLTAGVSVDFIVQMRDQFMNILTGDVTDTTVVVQASQMDNTSCDQPGTPDGTFLCTFTPIIFASSIQFGILVNGVYASYLHSGVGGAVNRIVGPYTATLDPGTYDASTCTISSGIRSAYYANIQAQLTITLKDLYGNSLVADPSPAPAVAATLTPSVGSPETVSVSSSFNGDGTVTLTIQPTLTGTGLTLAVTLDGTPVSSSNFPSGGISVITGLPSASSSTCDALTTGIAAGDSLSLTCTIMDAGSNALSTETFDVTTFFKHETDESVPVASATLTYDSGTYTASPSALLTTTGTYSFYTLVGQTGGLIGQYYETADYRNLIGTPLSDDRFVGDAPFEYTRIDAFLHFNWNAGPVLVNSVVAESVIWSGYLRPPTLGSAVTYQVTAYGGVRVTIGGVIVLDMLSASIVFQQTFTVTISTTPTIITINYIPGSSARFDFNQLDDTSSLYKTVPPSVLQAPLSIPVTGSVYTLSVTPAPVSSTSTATLNPTYTVNELGLFTITPKDVFGNVYTTDCTSLSTFACVWRITLVDSTGTTIVENAGDLGASVDYSGTGGDLAAAITFTADGPNYVNIEVSVDGGTTYAHITGTPYSVSVLV